MANQQLTAANIGRYRVRNPNAKEGFRDALYSFLTYAAAGQTNLRFFATPRGSGGFTTADTNLDLAGQLGAGNFFKIAAVEIYFFPGVNPVTSALALAAPNFANDVWAVAKGGWLELKVGQKTIIEEGPLGRFPPTARLEVQPALAVENTNAAVQNQLACDYAAMAGKPYNLAPPVTLEPNQPFTVNMYWPAAAALPSGQPGRIGVVFVGQKVRDV